MFLDCFLWAKCITIAFIAVIKYPEKNNLRIYSGLQFQKEYSLSLGLGRGTVTGALYTHWIRSLEVEDTQEAWLGYKPQPSEIFPSAGFYL